MALPSDQVAELKTLCSEVMAAEEGGLTYLLLPKLKMPPGIVPAEIRALLCPSGRDGYKSRLFFSVQPSGKTLANWNKFTILGETWYAPSWQTPEGLTLLQMVAEHLGAFK